MIHPKVGYLFIFLTLFLKIVAVPLDEHIDHYDVLEYERHALQKRHSIVRRSPYDKTIKLEFHALGRNFSLRLHPDTETFHDEAVIDFNGISNPLDTSHLFLGSVEGVSDSKVYGAITDGVFHGRLELPNGEGFQIEKKEFYRDNNHLQMNKKAHSVIYHDKSVDINGFFEKLRKRRSADSHDSADSHGFCGNSLKNTYEWMRKVQSSAQADKDRSSSFTHTDGDNPYLRPKREVSSSAQICNLFLQGDPELWRYYNDDVFGGKAQESQIREEITAMFQQHVQTVNGIYKSTTFVDPGTGTNFRQFGFRVDRVLINKTCESGATHPFCNRNIDASNLLNLNSFRNHDAYCLAHLFTYRDFDGGTLGLAWVAEPGKVGGICSENRKVLDGNVQRLRSLNTGIITLNNYRKTVPPRVSVITLAHEIGHNFGANHDKEQQNPSCTPFTDSSDDRGNFIMFASATTGTKDNNNRFSQCSIRSIGAVLYSVTKSLNGHRNCFIAARSAWCGNQIRESEAGSVEECDCGYLSDCGGNPSCCSCCNGQADDNNNARACKLKEKDGKPVSCDPSQGPCCSNQCSLIANTTGLKCAPATDCRYESYCNGKGATCPPPLSKANHTACNNNTQLCVAGECTGSICEKIKTNGKPWIPCSVPRNEKDKYDPHLCYISCAATNQSTCFTSANVDQSDFPPEFKQMLREVNNGSAIKMPAGQACDMDRGFCDHFQKCRAVNVKGPLARLKDLLFSPASLDKIKAWVTEYWWAVALSIQGFIGMMVLFAYCCAVHTPSSNPNQKPARQLSQTLTLRRRRAAQNQQPSAPPEQSRQSRPPPPSYSDVVGEPPIEVLSRNPGHSKPQGHRQHQYEMRGQPRK